MNSVLVGYLLLCFALMLLLVACGGMTKPTITATPLLPSTRDLQAALLTTSDLPAGFANLSVQSSNELGTSPCDATPPHLRYIVATADFQQGEHGDHVSEAIASFHAGEASQWFDALKQGPVCDHFDQTVAGSTPVTTQLAPLSFEPIGDQVFGYQMSTSFGAQTVETDVVYIREGDDVVMVGESTPGNVDPDFLRSLEQKALDKLQAAGF